MSALPNKSAPTNINSSRTKPAISKPAPDLIYEKALWKKGRKIVCGIDEVGKGAWAGPLTIGVAVVGDDKPPAGINDSKALTEKRREEMFDDVASWCKYWSVGSATSKECDELGMSQAQRLAASRALDSLGIVPDWALLDGKWNFLEPANTSAQNIHTTNIHATNIVKGDQTSLSIAAASILAKVSRDRQMRKIGDTYGPYRFANNKGYRCQWHVAALKAWGATPIHRKKWSFMSEAAFGECSY